MNMCMRMNDVHNLARCLPDTIMHACTYEAAHQSFAGEDKSRQSAGRARGPISYDVLYMYSQRMEIYERLYVHVQYCTYMGNTNWS
jgi:hypothetical protein